MPIRTCPRCEQRLVYRKGKPPTCGCVPRETDPKTPEELQRRAAEARKLRREGKLKTQRGGESKALVPNEAELMEQRSERDGWYT